MILNLKIVSIARKPFRAGCDQEDQKERDWRLQALYPISYRQGPELSSGMTFHTILASWASCFSLMSRLCSHQLTIHKELCASSRGIMTFHSSSIHCPRSLVSIFCSGAALPSGLLSHRAQSLAWQTRTTAGPIDKSPPAGTTEALGAFPSFSCLPHK